MSILEFNEFNEFNDYQSIEEDIYLIQQMIKETHSLIEQQNDDLKTLDDFIMLTKENVIKSEEECNESNELQSKYRTNKLVTSLLAGGITTAVSTFLFPVSIAIISGGLISGYIIYNP